MKIRSGFITNSSSAQYIIRNITSQTKTMLDLLEEASDGNWELVVWNYDTEYSSSSTRKPPKGNPKLEQQFREEVAKTETFPPHSQTEISIAWGDGGPIYSPEGFSRNRTRSFIIRCIGP